MGGDMLSVTTYGFNKTGGENIIGTNLTLPLLISLSAPIKVNTYQNNAKSQDFLTPGRP